MRSRRLQPAWFRTARREHGGHQEGGDHGHHDLRGHRDAVPAEQQRGRERRGEGKSQRGGARRGDNSGGTAAPGFIPEGSAASEDHTLIGNVNVHALDVNSDAIATAVLTFAYDTSTVNDAPGHPGRGLVKPGEFERTLATMTDRSAR